MLTKFIEASDERNFNWGKFAVCRFEPEEWSRKSGIGTPSSLLRQRGWTPEHTWVLDLETGEGVWIRPGGLASADLDKHNVWVCPMFEPFLAWLYRQDLVDLAALPSVVNLGKVETNMAGYRRDGRLKFFHRAAVYIDRLAKKAKMTATAYLDQQEAGGIRLVKEDRKQA